MQIELAHKCLKFATEALRPPAPQTWDDGSNSVVVKTPYYKLRLFKGEGRLQKKCVILFPPHAGRHPNVTNNLIRTCQEEGYDVYVFELLAATLETKNANLKNLVEFGTDCYAFPDQKKILMGVCQGLWLSNLVADKLVDIQDPPVAQFGFAGPVDFSAGNGHIKKTCQKIPLGYLESIVTMNGGFQLGYSQWWNFTLGNPKAVFYDDYVKLWNLINEDKDITDWRNNHDWFWSPQDLAGPWFLEAKKWFTLEKPFPVDFSRFTWPLFLYAGKEDEITPPEQTFAMAKMVGSRFVKEYIFENCGHTATFCKREPMQKVKENLRLISDGFKEVQYAA